MGQRWKNLSFRLPAFVLLVSLVPLTGFGLFAIEHSKRVLLETQGRATTRITTVATELVEQQLSEILTDLETDAENLDLVALSGEDLEWALLTILRQHKEIKEVMLIATSGQEKVRVAEDHVFLPRELMDQSDNPAFLAAITGKTFIGEPRRHDQEHANSGYLSHFSLPLIDPSTQSIFAVLIVDVSLRESLAKVTKIRIGHSGSVYVVEGRGRIIAHDDSSLVLGGVTLPLDGLTQTIGADRLAAVSVFQNTSGVEVQGVLVPIRGTDWLVVGERPMDGILSDLNQQSEFLQYLLVGLLLIMIPVLYFFNRRIVRPLQQLEHGAAEIGSGRFGVVIPVVSEDEIGSVARSFNLMASNLQTMMDERKQIDWQKNGLIQLDETLRGVTSIEVLAPLASSFLAQYCKAPVAALYLKNNAGQYKLSGGFAHEYSASDSQEFAVGQGLIGQVAYEGKVMELSDLPDDYLKVGSGVGESVAQSLVLLPLLHDGDVLGVLELGAFKPFSKETRTFLELAASALAISISMALTQKKLSESLQKSQRFTEELQAQQEELQAANEELEEQTNRLTVSEEELQAANEELEEKALSLEQQKLKLKDNNRKLEEARLRLERHSQELQVVSSYKSEFLANMSHELRTPLNSLLILSQDLAANSDENLTAGQIESAEVIYNSGKDLGSVRV